MTSVGELAGRHRQFSRSVLVALAFLATIAIIGPLVSYRSDVAESRTQVQTRVAREALFYANSLWLHFDILLAELERVAQRPEVNLGDDIDEPEQALLHLAHHHSTLFGGGVAFLSLDGRPVWSEPRDLFPAQGSLTGRPWFQKVLAMQEPVVDALGGQEGQFVVAVPVLRGGRATGMVVGLIQASDRLLPTQRQPGEELVVIGRAGDVLLPKPAPDWSLEPDFPQRAEALAASSGANEWSLHGSKAFAFARPVGTSGLKVVLLADEEAAIAPIRGRLLMQLLFIAVLQLSTLLVFSLFLRRTYRSFLLVEARAVEQEKMAVLGSAASLIAHEVKNSLNGLNAAASLLSAGEDPTLPVKSLRGQVDRLRHLASSLLYFGKPSAPHPAALAIDQSIAEAVEGLRSLPEAEEVELAVGPPCGLKVEGDPLLLITALDNLVRNAIEAAVQAKDLGRCERPQVWVRSRADGASYALVEVEDNAGGPPEGFELRLFEPFVTTKPRGIGLGLSMAQRAIEQQGGKLSFARTSTGSRFTLRLRLVA